MISLQRSKQILPDESLSKKRKWDDDRDGDPTQDISEKPDKIEGMNARSDSNLQTQFPLEWQRCLDIKSGQVYFYNARTNKRTLEDPKSSLGTYNPPPMSLELELNLPCQSQDGDKYKKHDCGTTSIYPYDHFKGFNTAKDVKKGLTKSPSWLTFEVDDQEMVTAVCKSASCW